MDLKIIGISLISFIKFVVILLLIHKLPTTSNFLVFFLVVLDGIYFTIHTNFKISINFELKINILFLHCEFTLIINNRGCL